MTGAQSAPGVLHLRLVGTAEPAAEGVDWQAAPPEMPARDDYVQGSLAVDFRQEAYDTFFGPQATATDDLPEARRQVVRRPGRGPVLPRPARLRPALRR